MPDVGLSALRVLRGNAVGLDRRSTVSSVGPSGHGVREVTALTDGDSDGPRPFAVDK